MMMRSNSWDVIIVGGGLAGLASALHLSRSKLKLLLIEKEEYPHHKVCGEYVSNEILSYLNSLEIDPLENGAKRIDKFIISNRAGDELKTELPLGGFGISRYTLDHLMYKKLKERMNVFHDSVTSISYSNDNFQVITNNKSCYTAKVVVGAFGKRSNLDKFMQREFIETPSPWLAVKSHYTYEFPDDTVALHNFDGGYCGLSKTETNAVNACYLTTYDSFKRFGNIPDFENNVLTKNKHLDHFFSNSIPLFEKPLSISQVSFNQKQPIKDHVFMIGDSAGLIHPLCGNGMAMAIHSAKIFSEICINHFNSEKLNRSAMEEEYVNRWNATFSKRLKAGRVIQNLLLRPMASSVGFSIAKMFPSIVPRVIKQTHGDPVL
tara:strand:- start:243681 stop:244811 length:1131 start_codon:yes stop_codon:yes gene_type:complete